MNIYQEEIDDMEKKLAMVEGFTPEQVQGAKRLFIQMIKLNIRNYNKLNHFNNEIRRLQGAIKPSIPEKTPKPIDDRYPERKKTGTMSDYFAGD